MISYITKGSAYFLVPIEPNDYKTEEEVKAGFLEGAIFRVAGCDTMCTYRDFINIKVPIHFNNLTQFVILEV